MSDSRTTKRALMTWGVGRRYVPPSDATGAAVLMVENPEHVAAVLAGDVLAAHGVIFVPAGSPDVEHAMATVIPLTGDPSEPATELSVGDDIYVQLQDYATAEYMSLIGPTLVRLVDPADFGVYLADLDRAVTEGIFPEYLTHPSVQLADQPALAGTLADDGPRLRLHLDAAGTWSTSATGAALGDLGSTWSELNDAWVARQRDSTWPCAVCVANVVPEDERVAAWQERPWAGHHLAAQAAMRDLAARGVRDVKVSGFGGRLSKALAPWPTIATSPWRTPDATSPVLAWNDDRAYLHLPDRDRTFALDRSGADVVEALLTCGSITAATDLADPTLLAQAAATLRGFGIDVAHTPGGDPR